MRGTVLFERVKQVLSASAVVLAMAARRSRTIWDVPGWSRTRATTSRAGFCGSTPSMDCSPSVAQWQAIARGSLMQRLGWIVSIKLTVRFD